MTQIRSELEALRVLQVAAANRALKWHGIIDHASKRFAEASEEYTQLWERRMKLETEAGYCLLEP